MIRLIGYFNARYFQAITNAFILTKYVLENDIWGKFE